MPDELRFRDVDWSPATRAFMEKHQVFAKRCARCRAPLGDHAAVPPHVLGACRGYRMTRPLAGEKECA